MHVIAALGAGLTGATALTVLHETVRRQRDDAPRVDVLGEQAIAGSMRSAGLRPPAGADLRRAALAGDIVSNSLYYSLIGLGDPAGVWWRGGLLGLAAGVGAVMLPGPLGLDPAASDRTPQTQAMTIAWYVAGGLAAAAAYRAFAGSENGN